jgi:hypothetical protein
MNRLAKKIGLGVGLTSLTLAALAIAADKPQKLTKQELPPAVVKAADTRLPGAELTSAEKETEDGNVVFDLELKQHDLKYEMDVKEDGTILEIEKQIKEIPVAVAASVKARYPQAQVKEVMEVNKVTGTIERPDHYEVTIANGEKSKEVVVSLDGSSVKEEADEEKPEGK